ncbi:putative oxidoreductase/Short-chain dehydrogenase [Devosia sp. LC5]|uniref:SDR family oxidoreductase n=1 Tax=Devosia sp. LC5 TaxID=1502724 RepID=UPI0004E34791|nr:SDR family oxidoreductase [Devosia sp. LC5]KFC69762.1 putative oxidoreductase/Short-chain dehydrogenase [Devosia sp. LC5]
MVKWTASEIPSQKDRLAVVTGTGGLGFEDALALARAGGEVIIAGRNPQKGAEAVDRIRSDIPSAKLRFERLDLASLRSVEDFAGRMMQRHERLDILINNAGVMVPPARQETEDGFELQFGTNYLGHFALTAHLLPLLQKGRDARVVTLSSVAARNGHIDFADLQSAKTYNPNKAYAQSKIACLIFARELQRRSDLGRWGIASIGSHPGVSRTDLLHNAPGRLSAVGLARSLLWFLFQPAAQGALPTLYAATALQAQPGGYYGPDRLNETRGFPAMAKVPPQALDQAVAERLWQLSEQLTGVTMSRPA